jgi:hypothetical protein
MRRLLIFVLAALAISVVNDRAEAQEVCFTCDVYVDWNDLDALGWPYVDISTECGTGGNAYYFGGECDDGYLLNMSGHAMPPIPTCEELYGEYEECLGDAPELMARADHLIHAGDFSALDVLIQGSEGRLRYDSEGRRLVALGCRGGVVLTRQVGIPTLSISFNRPLSR